MRSGLMKKLWGIEEDQIELGPMIGEGSFGKVYEGVYAGTHVAVKKMVLQVRRKRKRKRERKSERERAREKEKPYCVVYSSMCLLLCGVWLCANAVIYIICIWIPLVHQGL